MGSWVADLLYVFGMGGQRGQNCCLHALCLKPAFDSCPERAGARRLNEGMRVKGKDTAALVGFGKGNKGASATLFEKLLPRVGL